MVEAPESFQGIFGNHSFDSHRFLGHPHPAPSRSSLWMLQRLPRENSSQKNQTKSHKKPGKIRRRHLQERGREKWKWGRGKKSGAAAPFTEHDPADLKGAAFPWKNNGKLQAKSSSRPAWKRFGSALKGRKIPLEFSASKGFCRSEEAGKDQRFGAIPEGHSQHPNFPFAGMEFFRFSLFFSVFPWLRQRRMERGILGSKYWENREWKSLGMEAGNWWEEEQFLIPNFSRCSLPLESTFPLSSLTFPGVPIPWNPHSHRMISTFIPPFSRFSFPLESTFPSWDFHVHPSLFQWEKFPSFGIHVPVGSPLSSLPFPGALFPWNPHSHGMIPTLIPHFSMFSLPFPGIGHMGEAGASSSSSQRNSQPEFPSLAALEHRGISLAKSEENWDAPG